MNLSAQGRPTPTSNDVAAKLAVLAVTADLKTIVFVQQAGYAPSTAKRLRTSYLGLASFLKRSSPYGQALRLNWVVRAILWSILTMPPCHTTEI